MKELYDNVVHQYASHWEELAAHLGLENYHVANISKNHENNQNKSVSCWTAVLKQWLRTVHSPTWGKLEDAIGRAVHSPTWGKLEDVIGSSNFEMNDDSGTK